MTSTSEPTELVVPAESDPDLYQQLARLRERGPVLRVTTGKHRLPVWLVTGYDQARAALADGRLSKDTRRAQHIFARRGPTRNLSDAVGVTMLATDPPDHTRLRRLVGKAFTAGAVAPLEPAIRRIVDELIDGFDSRDTVDLVEDFAVPLPVTVICELLGVPECDRPSVRALSDAVFTAGRPDVIDRASHELAAYMATLVARKRAHPDDDLLSELAAVVDGSDRLTDTELVSLATLLLIAGHETTANLIGNGMLALLQHPDQHAALRDEPGLVPRAIEEFLRYDPPAATATFRWSAEPVDYGETRIPADEVVMVSLAAANHDPARFPDPDSLDIHRDASGHLAFGHGIHHCLGAPLARLEARIAFTELLERHPRLRLATNAATLPRRRTRLMRGLEHLPVLQ